MGFTNPVGPVRITSRAGIDIDPVTGLMRLYTDPGNAILVDGDFDMAGGIVAAGPIIGRAGLYTGGTDPDGGHQVFPTTCGLFSGNSVAVSAQFLVNHGGHTTPSAVFWQVAGGSPPGATITHLNRDATTIRGELRDAAGALAPATAFAAFWLAVFPS